MKRLNVKYFHGRYRAIFTSRRDAPGLIFGCAEFDRPFGLTGALLVSHRPANLGEKARPVSSASTMVPVETGL